jgi:hypothetical protein
VSFDELIPTAEMTDAQFDRVLKINGLPGLDDPIPANFDVSKVVPLMPRRRR